MHCAECHELLIEYHVDLWYPPFCCCKAVEEGDKNARKKPEVAVGKADQA